MLLRELKKEFKIYSKETPLDEEIWKLICRAEEVIEEMRHNPKDFIERMENNAALQFRVSSCADKLEGKDD